MPAQAHPKKLEITFTPAPIGAEHRACAFAGKNSAWYGTNAGEVRDLWKAHRRACLSVGAWLAGMRL